MSLLAAEASGNGYFVFSMNSDKIGTLDGEYGIGEDETGGQWKNVKQVGKAPDLNSIKGDMQGTAPPAAIAYFATTSPSAASAGATFAMIWCSG